uniref:Putative ovule protein n=1 Tax=Solanum chacoense TaxID=4108 RepID=A0A0V0GLA6_SOLCH
MIRSKRRCRRRGRRRENGRRKRGRNKFSKLFLKAKSTDPTWGIVLVRMICTYHITITHVFFNPFHHHCSLTNSVSALLFTIHYLSCSC